MGSSSAHIQFSNQTTPSRQASTENLPSVKIRHFANIFKNRPAVLMTADSEKQFSAVSLRDQRGIKQQILNQLTPSSHHHPFPINNEEIVKRNVQNGQLKKQREQLSDDSEGQKQNGVINRRRPEAKIRHSQEKTPSDRFNNNHNLSNRKNLPESMKHLVSQMNRINQSRTIKNSTSTKEHLPEHDKTARKFNKLMKRVQGLNDIVQGQQHKMAGNVEREVANLNSNNQKENQKSMATYRYSKAMEQKKRNAAYLVDNNSSNKIHDFQKQGPLYEALPNQLIEQSTKPQGARKQRKDRMTKHGRNEKKVVTAYIDLNKRRDQGAEGEKEEQEEDRDLNDNSGKKIQDDEDDCNHDSQNLVINVMQPIMSYHSQTKTDKSCKDNYEVLQQNHDTGQTVKQVQHQVLHKTEQNSAVNRDNNNWLRLSQGVDWNNSRNVSYSPSKNVDHLNDVSSFEPVEVSNNTILKQKLPDSMRMPINDHEIHESIFNNYSGKSHSKKIQSQAQNMNYDGDYNVKTEEDEDQAILRIASHQINDDLEEEGSFKITQKNNMTMVDLPYHQSEQGRMVGRVLSAQSRQAKTQTNQTGLQGDPRKQQMPLINESFRKQSLKQRHQNTKNNTSNVVPDTDHFQNSIDKGESLQSRNEHTISLNFQNKSLKERNREIFDDDSSLSITKHQALFQEPLAVKDHNETSIMDQQSSSLNPFTHKHSEVKQEQPVKVSPLQLKKLFKKKCEQDKTINLVGLSTLNGSNTARDYQKNCRLMKNVQVPVSARDTRKMLDDTVRLSLRLSNLKSVPPTVFQNNNSLIEVDLRNNRLTSLPDQICNQSQLAELKLDYNFLNALPARINKLTNLKYLSISQNNLKKLPHTLMLLGQSLKTLIVNDNKLSYLSGKIGNLYSLQVLLLHNNSIKEVPSTFYRLGQLEQLSLDWFSYLNTDFLTNQTKILKPDVMELDCPNDEDAPEEHKKVLTQFLNMCKMYHIFEFKKIVEAKQAEQHQNPQADDSEPVSRIQINFNEYLKREMMMVHNTVVTAAMTKGVTSKNRKDKFNDQSSKQGPEDNGHQLEESNDPLMFNKAVPINFLKFLMFFYKVSDFEILILKSLFPSKQRKLSHMIALNGHQYLLKDFIKQLNIYIHNCTGPHQKQLTNLSFQNNCDATQQNTALLQQIQQQQVKLNQCEYQFLNAIDRDFSTPLILALRNQKNKIVRVLINQPKICLSQQSMKYGMALHVALQNHDFRLALKMARAMVKTNDFHPSKDFNRTDSEGNTPLHLVMRYFNNDVHFAKKICLFLLQNGANLKIQNKNELTPLSQALYYVQNSATCFALKYNELMRSESEVESDFPLFDFNERSSKLMFTPLHYSVKQNNFELLINLLKSNENLNHQLEDALGRIPVHLCNTISAIFKTLRRELMKQRIKLVQKNMESIKQQEVEFQNYHQQLLLTFSLTHTFQNSQATRMKKFKMKGQMSTLGNRLSTTTRTNSVKQTLRSNTIMAAQGPTPLPKPPQTDLRLKQIKSPHSIKAAPHSMAPSAPGTLRKEKTPTAAASSSALYLLNEGEPRTLPQAFGKKISCQELNGAPAAALQDTAGSRVGSNGPAAMYTDAAVTGTAKSHHGVKKLQIHLYDQQKAGTDGAILKEARKKPMHVRDRSADVGLKIYSQNSIQIFSNNVRQDQQIQSKKNVTDDSQNVSANNYNEAQLNAIDGRINMMRNSHQFTALNRKSSYDMSLQINNSRKNNFNMPRQTVQVNKIQKLDNIFVTQKFRSINEIKREQDKIATALNSTRGDLMNKNSNIIMMIAANSTMTTSGKVKNSNTTAMGAPVINMSNMQKYSQTIKDKSAKEHIALGSSAAQSQKGRKQVWVTYKQLMFRSMVLDSEGEDEDGNLKNSDNSSQVSNSSHENSSNFKDNSQEEGENLQDDEVTDNQMQYQKLQQDYKQVMKREQQMGPNVAGIMHSQQLRYKQIRPLNQSRTSPNSSMNMDVSVVHNSPAMMSASKGGNFEFEDTDDLLNYLFTVYRLKNEQRHFDLIEEIECTLQGKKYHDRKGDVETNQVVYSPTIDQQVKQNIKEKMKNWEQQLSNGESKNENYEIELSDDTQEQQKDINLQILGQTKGVNKVSHMIKKNEIEEPPELDIHDIVDDDINETAIEPIQNSKTHYKMQSINKPADSNQRNLFDKSNYLSSCNTPPLLVRNECGDPHTLTLQNDNDNVQNSKNTVEFHAQTQFSPQFQFVQSSMEPSPDGSNYLRSQRPKQQVKVPNKPIKNKSIQKLRVNDADISQPQSETSNSVERASHHSRSALDHSNFTVPTTMMGADADPDEKCLNPSVPVSDTNSLGDSSKKASKGITIPDFNNNKSKQFHRGSIFSGKMASIFGKKRSTYLNYSHNTAAMSPPSQNPPHQQPGSSHEAEVLASYHKQPDAKISRKKQMMKKEVSEESFDIGSGTESAMLDVQIDVGVQMRMQNVRTLISLVRKMYAREIQRAAGTPGKGDIAPKERLQIRQLVDDITLDAHYMTTMEACTQFKVYIDQLMRLLKMYDNSFVRLIANDLVSVEAFVQNNICVPRHTGY